jgi:CubicO group peptidase (beta-lactamase class C family)
MLSRVERVLGEACGSWFTGAVCRVEHRGQVVFEEAYGVTRDDDFARPVYLDTRFDLASLTKLFVGTLALGAVQEERITLDSSLVQWFPEWGGRAQERITLRMLLTHTSGMNSGADFRQLFDENVERYAIERELVAMPGEHVIYSDLGFIVLGVLLERLHGVSLHLVLKNFLNQKQLAVKETRPGAREAVLRVDYAPAYGEHRDIPATEDDGWRGRVQGVVHDEKAYLMNGVAGHAGLFGTASDVAWLTENYLAAIHHRASGIPYELVREAVHEQAYDPTLRRGLGWALKTSDENSCGRYFSPGSFGHTGFVGTCVWADPVRDVQAVLLTNAVYFGRRDIRDLRVAFYDAVIEDIS